MYGPHKGLEPSSLTLEIDVRRADTFLLALSVAFSFTVLDKGPLGSGRDLVTEKYFNNAMIVCEHWNTGTVAIYTVQFANKNFREQTCANLRKSQKTQNLNLAIVFAIQYYNMLSAIFPINW